MKGVIKVEFILGVVIFAIIIFYIATQINTSFSSVNADTRLDILKSESISILAILATDKDIGLAYEKDVLDINKITTWEATKTSTNQECTQMKYFELGGYRLNIYHESYSAPILFCGYVGLSPIRTTVTRHIKFNDGHIGNMTLELW